MNQLIGPSKAMPFAALLSLTALACEPPLPDEITCSGSIDCPVGRRCDVARGLCIPVDAGVRDSVSAVDSGRDAAQGDATADAAAAPDSAAIHYAVAGEDQDVELYASVTLDGAASVLPPDAVAVDYYWSFVDLPVGSSARLANPFSVSTSFVAADPHGHYEVELTVTADGVQLPQDQVQIDVLNSAPVANAGADLFAYPGDGVQLDGTASADPDGDRLSYGWSLLQQSLGSLDDPGSEQPNLLCAPAYVGPIEVLLEVDDGHGGVDSDSVTVTTDDDLPPIITLAASQTTPHHCAGAPLRCEASATLSAVVVEPEGQTVDLLWSLLSCPGGAPLAGTCPGGVSPALATPSASVTSFHVETDSGQRIAGDYLVELVAVDSEGNGSSAQLALTVVNRPPTGLGATETVAHLYAAGTYYCEVPFAVSATDADGDALSLQFQAPVGTSVTPGQGFDAVFLTTTQVAEPSFLGPHAITVTVADGQGGSVELDVSANCSNSPPVISNLADVSAPGHSYEKIGEVEYYRGQITVQADVDDADAEPLSCNWTVDSPVSGVSYDSFPVASPAIASPPELVTLDAQVSSVDSVAVVTTHGLALTCSDGFTIVGSPFGVEVTNRPPTVDAGQNVTVHHEYVYGVDPLSADVLLSGRTPPTGAVDPDGDPLQLTWSAPGLNTEVHVAFDPGPDVLEPSVTLYGEGPVVGTHSLRLDVVDSCGAQVADTFTVTVDNRPPTITAGDDMAVDHVWVGPGTYRAVFDLGARATVARGTDPDGDPLDLVWAPASTPAGTQFIADPDLSATNPEISVQGGTGVVGAHSWTVTVVDVLGLDASDTAVLTARNRLPVETSAVVLTPDLASTGAACRRPGQDDVCDVCGTCGLSLTASYAASFSDPDGDPIMATVIVEAPLNDAVITGNSQSGGGISFDDGLSTLSADASIEVLPLSRTWLCGGTATLFRFLQQTRPPQGFYVNVDVTTTVSDAFGSTNLVDGYQVQSTNGETCP